MKGVIHRIVTACLTTSQSGVTLVELALAIAILSVVTLATSQLFLTSVQNQQNERLHVMQTHLLSTITSQIRADMLLSRTVSLSNGGNTLNFVHPNGDRIMYDVANNTITRTVNGTAVDYRNTLPEAWVNNMALLCNNPCFTLEGTTRVAIRNLEARDVSTANTTMDTVFGKMRLRLPEVTINKLAGFEFQ